MNIIKIIQNMFASRRLEIEKQERIWKPQEDEMADIKEAYYENKEKVYFRRYCCLCYNGGYYSGALTEQEYNTLVFYNPCCGHELSEFAYLLNTFNENPTTEYPEGEQNV